MSGGQITLYSGLHAKDHAAAAQLYWQAFSEKLDRILGPPARAQVYLQGALCPHHIISAYDQGQLVGLIAFKTAAGGFVRDGFAPFRAAYGLWGGGWRYAVLARFCTEVDHHHFIIDGLCVAPASRSQGIGRLLIKAACHEAQRRGYRAVRLDVAAQNSRARALYAGCGFADHAITPLGWPGRWLKTRHIVTMVRGLF